MHETAKYIWENNESVTRWPSEPKSVFDVVNKIQKFIHSGADKNAQLILKEKALGQNLENEWVSYTGTGGFFVLFELESETEDSITIGATILADVAVSNPNPGYVTEFIDNIEHTS